MSADTLMLLRTPLPAAQVRTALVHDPALADLGLADNGEWVGMGNKRLSLTVNPWDGDELDMIPDGFETADVTVTLTPGWGVEGWEAMQRVLAAVLRLVPGDVCLANENAAGPDLLRLGGVVYINPDGFRPDNLARFGHTPERIVVGIPAQAAEAAAE